MSDYLKPWPRHCNNCEGEEGDHVAKLGRCKGCRTHYYCDTECQLESWEDHKLLCRLGRIVEKREGRGPRRWIKAHRHLIILAISQMLRFYDNYDMARESCLVLDVVTIPSGRRRHRRGRKSSPRSGFVVSAIRLVDLDDLSDEVFDGCGAPEQGSDEDAYRKRHRDRLDRIRNHEGVGCESMALLKFETDPNGPWLAKIMECSFPPRSWDRVANWQEHLFRMSSY